jgi:hypothetical protein
LSSLSRRRANFAPASGPCRQARGSRPRTHSRGGGTASRRRGWRRSYLACRCARPHRRLNSSPPPPPPRARPPQSAHGVGCRAVAAYSAVGALCRSSVGGSLHCVGAGFRRARPAEQRAVERWGCGRRREPVRRAMLASCGQGRSAADVRRCAAVVCWMRGVL